MSESLANVSIMIHPWRALRELADVTLEFVELRPGLLGYTDHDTNTIYLAKGMRQRQRRSVLQHELGHLERGKIVVGSYDREERAVDVATAHALIDLEQLTQALLWTRNVSELADELHVSRDVVECRLKHLHPAERHYLKRRLSDPADSA